MKDVRLALVPWWRILAIAAGVVTVAALARGIWQLVRGRKMEAANWVMAAGGMGIFIFSTVQLHRDAGVPEHIAMKLTGHKTRDIFDGYDIVSERDLADGVAKLATFHQGRVGAR